ncbi:branched-chain amino acid transport system II carrier protein [Lactobacillus helveticus]|uniref:branched-chain amino acid transport system II carrier protein n=5 Tax=Lactobacillus helveticus TaxID=1587 RepID=UPI00207D5A57|nr:branched-chain amino acid transport system II carrier protein [Lactobacillus helveticus]MCO0808443.1 branched-chain amino acid transport system II carrier protein [Lactobacillus helveticus]MDN6035242.1 branched-chain amino acid transport system II carrier protein [Lactococcus lactis]
MKVLQLNIRLQFFSFFGISIKKTSAYSQERHHFKSEFKFTAKVFKCLTSATLDMIVSMPAVISQSSFGLAVAHLRNAIPLAGQGLSWVVPMIVGLIIGTIIFKIKVKNN